MFRFKVSDPNEFVAVIVTWDVPRVVGVPEMRPVVVLNVRPAGRAVDE